jgi:hypothetical protein
LHVDENKKDDEDGEPQSVEKFALSQFQAAEEVFGRRSVLLLNIAIVLLFWLF